MITPEELERLEQQCRLAHWNAEQARQARNDAIHQALAAGWTHQQIADATGLSRQRVNQIKTSG